MSWQDAHADADSDWQWVSGEAFAYANWENFEPNRDYEHFVHLFVSGDTMGDTWGNGENSNVAFPVISYVVEYDALPEAPMIVSNDVTDAIETESYSYTVEAFDADGSVDIELVSRERRGNMQLRDADGRKWVRNIGRTGLFVGDRHTIAAGFDMPTRSISMSPGLAFAYVDFGMHEQEAPDLGDLDEGLAHSRYVRQQIKEMRREIRQHFGKHASRIWKAVFGKPGVFCTFYRC